jgi:hypothetical protein
MVRSVLLGMALTIVSLLAAAPVAAQDGCTRASLAAAVDSYVAAQKAGDPSIMALMPPVKYVENKVETEFAKAILHTPLKIDFHRSIFDTRSCESFTELTVTDPAHPYVIGTRLKAGRDGISEIESLVTDADDWLFHATNTRKFAAAENWNPIPADSRAGRAALIAAADAYLDLFNDKDVKVPWGSPCARLEGGLYTGRGLPTDTCNIGVPSGIELKNRRYIVDEELGSVVVLLDFGPQNLPDSHLFRVENGTLRYVHTITVCRTFNCGFPVPEMLKQP